MSLTSSLRKIKQDILIPEDNGSSRPVEIHQQCFSLAKLYLSR